MKSACAFVVALLIVASSNAATYCNGTVKAVYKWSNMSSLSIQVLMADGTITNWISMPTKSDEAMALLALSAGKQIELYWSPTDVTVCANGWVHNRVLEIHGCQELMLTMTRVKGLTVTLQGA